MSTPATSPIKLPPPFTRSAPITKNPRSLLLYGAPKVGKTEAVAQLKDAVIIQCEPGADTWECTRTPVVRTLAEFKGVCKQIIDAGRPYKYVVVDTITALEELCQTAATLMYKASPVGKTFTGEDVCTELPNGAGYLWLRRMLDEALAAVTAATPADGCVVYIAHLKDKLLVIEGKDVTAKDVNLTGKCGVIVCSRCDAVGHLTRRNRTGVKPGMPPADDLWLSFRTSEFVNAGSRCEHLAGKEFVFGKSEDHAARWDLIFTPAASV